MPEAQPSLGKVVINTQHAKQTYKTHASRVQVTGSASALCKPLGYDITTSAGFFKISRITDLANGSRSTESQHSDPLSPVDW